MSFNLNFHPDGTPDEPHGPYKVTHRDYRSEDTPVCRPYTSASIETSDGCVTIFMPYGHRVQIGAAQ